MIKLFIAIQLCVLLINNNAQPKTLTLFTKSACNNCKYTKYYLNKSNIAFTEYSLADNKNAATMIRKIKQSKYTGNIFLPVIFVNDTILLHPFVNATDSDQTLEVLVQEIVKNKVQYKHAETANNINEAINTNQSHNKPDTANAHANQSDCSYTELPQYLVCGNFKDIKQAQHFKQVLLNQGYNNTNFVFYNEYYRVYITSNYLQTISDTINKNYTLTQVRKKYRGAYLLKIE